ncbi:ABC transporter permease [Streptomyces sp. 4.24]|uniref:ABC transporter permease n=1 Tax=Streptomyces tritrimontium TaxID=3406573 RepID=UPI003BB52218
MSRSRSTGGGAGGGPGAAEAVAAETRRVRRRARTAVLLGTAVPVGLLAAWECAARLAFIDPLLFPAPSRTGACAAALVASGELGGHAGATATRLFSGYALGAVAGIAAGFAMGVSRYVRAALTPLFTALYCVPKVAVLPLLLLVFGLSETPKVLAVAITVFFVLQINTLAGVSQIDPRMVETARSYGARGPRLLRAVLLPGAAPVIMTGLRTAAGLGVVVVVAVEFVASESGLGYLIWNSWTLFQPERMYAGILAVALLGTAFSLLLLAAERLVMPWRAGTR